MTRLATNLSIEPIKKRRFILVNVFLGGKFSFVQLENGKLYVFGRNDYGQLGLGDTNNRLSPVEMPARYYENKEIYTIHMGLTNAMIETTDGTLYLTGYNEDGIIGTGNKQNLLKPTIFPASNYGNEGIEQISFDVGNIAILTKEGSLYVGGNNDYGQLGLGDTKPRNGYVKVPPSTFNHEQIKQISCMQGSLFVLTYKRLYVVGKNDVGQLGLGDFENRDKFTFLRDGGTPLMPIIARVNTLKNATSLSVDSDVGFDFVKTFGSTIVKRNITSYLRGMFLSGYNHFANLTITNDVYTWGDNTYGQLGHNDGDKYVPTELPKSKYGNKEAKEIFCGANQTAVLTTDNMVYLFGDNSNFQLGDKPSFHKPIKKMALGKTHSAYITESGELYLAGRNTYGELGFGHTNVVKTFTKLPKSYFDGNPVKDVVVGDHFTVVLTVNGDLYTFGKNDKGQIIHSDKMNFIKPEKVNPYMYNNSSIKGFATNQDTLVIYTWDDYIYVYGNSDFIKTGITGANSVQFVTNPNYYNSYNYS